jgi:hypothetical protein
MMTVGIPGFCGEHSKIIIGNNPGSYFICTNDAGHDGDHTACDGQGHVLARWESPMSKVKIRGPQGEVRI